MDQQAEKGSDRKSTRTRQKNEREDMESIDSPEIPDRGGDIRHPWPPFVGCSSGVWSITKLYKQPLPIKKKKIQVAAPSRVKKSATK